MTIKNRKAVACWPAYASYAGAAQVLEAFALGEETPEQDHMGTLVDNEAICNVGGAAIDAFRVRSPVQYVAGRALCISWNTTTFSACPFCEPGAVSRKGLCLTLYVRLPVRALWVITRMCFTGRRRTRRAVCGECSCARLLF